jgi:hypothetical protein
MVDTKPRKRTPIGEDNQDDPKVRNDVYHQFVKRILKAYGKRIGAGDIAALPELVALEGELAATIEDAVRQLRAEPWCYSWAQIGKVLGITRQAAEKKWGHVGGARKVGGQPSDRR